MNRVSKCITLLLSSPFTLVSYLNCLYIVWKVWYTELRGGGLIFFLLALFVHKTSDSCSSRAENFIKPDRRHLNSNSTPPKQNSSNILDGPFYYAPFQAGAIREAPSGILTKSRNSGSIKNSIVSTVWFLIWICPIKSFDCLEMMTRLCRNYAHRHYSYFSFWVIYSLVID